MNHYYILYKPYQVLSQFSSVEKKRTLSDICKVPRDVYPVGRLDYDSEGLLILTNDTLLNHRLLDPVFAHEREYLVQVDGAITQAAVDALQNSVTIQVDGKPYQTKSCTASLISQEPKLPPRDPPIRFRKEIPAPWIQLVLTEGRNRQVRKMTAQVGFPTLRLVRYRIGSLTLDQMQPGDMLELTRNTLYQKIFHDNDR